MYLKVRNFEKFQHYKHRNPPWIRLYRDLLSDPEFYRLNGVLKFQIIGMTLLASRRDNKILADAEWIQSEIKSVEPVNLQDLMNTGFIEERKQRASTKLATREQVATPETEETETEVQRQSKEYAAEDPRRAPFVEYCFRSYSEQRGADLITDASAFKALKTFLSASKNKEAFSLECLKSYWLKFLASPDKFHQSQGNPLRFFCLNINAFAKIEKQIHVHTEKCKDYGYCPEAR